MIVLQIVNALAYLHEFGAVHGELRPSAVFFDADGIVQLATSSVHPSNQAMRLATVTDLERALYWSPEQAADLPVDGRSDVYSAALVCAQLISGKRPSTARSIEGLRQERQSSAPGVMNLGRLGAVIATATTNSVAQRVDAEEFGALLVEAAQELPRPRRLDLLPFPNRSVSQDAASEATDDGDTVAAGEPKNGSSEEQTRSMSAVFETKPVERITPGDSEELLRSSEALFGVARHLLDNAEIPGGERDAAESDMERFFAAYDRPLGPLPPVLRSYLSSVGRFVALHSGAVEALESIDEPIASHAAKLLRTLTHAAEDPETAGGAISDQLAELNALRPDLSGADPNDDLHRQLTIVRTATGVTSVVGVGQLGSFVINTVAGLGLGSFAAAISGLVISTIAGAAILYTRVQREKTAS